MLKKIGAAWLKSEKGSTYILTLALCVLGAAVIVPLLSFTATGLKTGTVFEKKTAEYYSADAGIQDSIWQIKYDHLSSQVSGYQPYDYTSSWQYTLSLVNGMPVNITIKNEWMPKDISPPSPAEAGEIINNPRLLVTGTTVSSDPPQYRIKIAYYPQSGDSFIVRTLAIWLPRGFSYVNGSSNLEADISAPFYALPDSPVPYKGGQVIIWHFHSTLTFDQLPEVNAEDSPMTAVVTFRYTAGQSGTQPRAISWVQTTSRTVGLEYAWDADVKIFKITAMCGGTTIEGYLPKMEIRHLSSVFDGDYSATGNSLMIDKTNDIDGIRDTKLSSSEATVDDIPADAEVGAAYLYWSAWKSEGHSPLTNVQFKIDNNWVYFDSDGLPQKGVSNLTADTTQVIYNTINSPSGGTDPNGISYSCKKDVTELIRAFAPHGNATYTVRDLNKNMGDTNNVLSYAGWSLIIIYTSPSTQGHQLYLYDDFLFMEPLENRGDLDFDGNGDPGGTISGFIVPDPVPGEEDAVKMTCFVGEGDECWSGDFLAFGAPAHYRTDTHSPNDPQYGIPDSYKLWDGTNSGVSGQHSDLHLLNDRYHHYNVWNGKSSGMSASGVDIDTFTVPWSSEKMRPGDTSANIDICSAIERWNLVYIILSFRSTTSTGGLLDYIIK
jgi:hypothetical protein